MVCSEGRDGLRWRPDGQACGLDEMCNDRFGCVARCTPGMDTRCVDISHQQTCTSVLSGVNSWGPPQECRRSMNEVCLANIGRCQMAPGICTVGELTCDSEGNVSECVRDSNGINGFVRRVNCLAEGFITCNPRSSSQHAPGSNPLIACGNACGGSGCRLSARRDDPVPGTTCARYVCDSLCSVRSDHCDCRSVSASCTDNCQCASLHCQMGVCVP